MRRKPGALVPLELAICEAAVRLRAEGRDEFHGYAMARSLKEAAEARLLTAYGTLYRALARLEQRGSLGRLRDCNRGAAPSTAVVSPDSGG